MSVYKKWRTVEVEGVSQFLLERGESETTFIIFVWYLIAGMTYVTEINYDEEAARDHFWENADEDDCQDLYDESLRLN
jgi:hypothetical protein